MARKGLQITNPLCIKVVLGVYWRTVRLPREKHDLMYRVGEFLYPWLPDPYEQVIAHQELL